VTGAKHLHINVIFVILIQLAHPHISCLLLQYLDARVSTPCYWTPVVCLVLNNVDTISLSSNTRVYKHHFCGSRYFISRWFISGEISFEELFRLRIDFRFASYWW